MATVEHRETTSLVHLSKGAGNAGRGAISPAQKAPEVPTHLLTCNQTTSLIWQLPAALQAQVFPSSPRFKEFGSERHERLQLRSAVPWLSSYAVPERERELKWSLSRLFTSKRLLTYVPAYNILSILQEGWEKQLNQYHIFILAISPILMFIMIWLMYKIAKSNCY